MKNVTSFFIMVLGLALSMLPSSTLEACSCGEFPTFCEKAVNYNLFMGRVVSQQHATSNVTLDAYFTNLEIIDFMNSTSLPDTVSMINQDGLNCNGDIFGLLPGDTVIISMTNLDYISYYNPDDYSNFPPHNQYELFGCGIYHLVVHDAKVGGISENQELVSLSDFLANSLENCPQVTSIENPLEGQVMVYPNPVKEQLYINNQAEEKISCTLFDINGTAINQFKVWPGQQEKLPMENIPAGTYLLKMEDGLHEYSRVIIRQ